MTLPDVTCLFIFPDAPLENCGNSVLIGEPRGSFNRQPVG